MAAAEWTGPDVVTAIMAGTALVLSLASLAWQIVQHRLTGARVSVALETAWVQGKNYATTPVTRARQRRPGPGAELAPLGMGAAARPYLAVRVVNRGRLPATVGNYTVLLPHNVQTGSIGGEHQTPVPKRLEVGEGAVFIYPVKEVTPLIKMDTRLRHHSTVPARMVVELGTGERLATRRSVRLSPG